MGVYIKGMKMPRWCNECKFHYWRDSLCEITNKEVDDDASMRGVQPWCPIIELPDHGDLIDRNMLIGGFADWYIQESPMYLGDSKVVAETIGDAMKAIEAAPAVIPAERSEASLCDNCDEQSDAGCGWCKRTERSEE